MSPVSSQVTRSSLSWNQESGYRAGPFAATRPAPESAITEQEVHQEHLLRAIHETLFGEAPYAHYFKDVEISIDECEVRLTGRVPSFYLKSVLQTRLQHACGSLHIENSVSVVSACGLSSTMV